MPRKFAKSAGGAWSRISKERLRELVEDATVDAYGESEEAVGWLTMIEDNVGFPFDTEVLGVAVTVSGVDVNEADELVAVCRRGRHRQKILVVDLPAPSPPPEGAEWIEAYRRWRKGSA